MAEQQTFIDNKGVVNVYHAKPSLYSNESKTELVNFRLEKSDFDEISSFAFKRGMTKSDFYREAGKLYKALYPYREKIEKHWKGLVALLENLT